MIERQDPDDLPCFPDAGNLHMEISRTCLQSDVIHPALIFSRTFDIINLISNWIING